MMRNQEKKRVEQIREMKPQIMILLNVVLITATVLLSAIYTENVQQEKKQAAIDNFCTTVESMKRVAGNYLQTEEKYAQSWALYIEENEMTMQQALAYIRMANTQSDRYAHIVDMDTGEARSTYIKNGSDSVSCYEFCIKDDSDSSREFVKNMESIFNARRDEIKVLGKYRIREMQVNAISVGTRVRLKTGAGTQKEYLLLRVIPLESMRNIWVFPLDYAFAEVGMITENGDYIIQSKSMKLENFIEFIRSYNYEGNYNGVDELVKALENKTSGLLRYKDSKGRKCYWYYSIFSTEESIYILGCIPEENLNVSESGWQFLIVTCVVFVLLLLMDGSYVGQINRQLRRTAMLAEEANEAKTRFLSSMSHDIRTPLNAIIGMGNIARQHMDDSQYVETCLRKISTAGNHLLTLVNNILDISKVESGNMVLSRSAFSLEKLISDILDIMQEQINEKQINLQVNLAEFPHPYLVGDVLRLNQVFINLLSNAVKYTEASGNIRLDIGEEEIEGEESKVRVTYTVADSGIGMTEEFQQIMYDTFSRATDSRIDKIQGSGLGLAIARQMVELMNGTIRCESRQGEGTTFYVMVELGIADEEQRRLLLKEEETYNKGLEEKAEEEFKGMNLLIAEDNDLNWEIIEELLKEYGVNCSRAENGAVCVQMLEAAADDTYDMVFMDIQMPLMNGKEAARKIRENDREYLKNITIYAMTADAFADDVEDCFKAGMNGHIAKPVDMKYVRSALRDAQRRKRKGFKG